MDEFTFTREQVEESGLPLKDLIKAATYFAPDPEEYEMVLEPNADVVRLVRKHLVKDIARSFSVPGEFLGS